MALKLLELAVLEWPEVFPIKSVLGWQLLLMVWASLRFDDGLHVSPSSFIDHPEGVSFAAWQTKTDRRRRRTACTACRVSLGGAGWLRTLLRAVAALRIPSLPFRRLLALQLRWRYGGLSAPSGLRDLWIESQGPLL